MIVKSQWGSWVQPIIIQIELTIKKFQDKLGHFNTQCQGSTNETQEVCPDFRTDPKLCAHNDKMGYSNTQYQDVSNGDQGVHLESNIGPNLRAHNGSSDFTLDKTLIVGNQCFSLSSASKLSIFLQLILPFIRVFLAKKKNSHAIMASKSH